MSKSDPVKILLERFLARGWTLSVAESCTSGLISATLGKSPGISQIFSGAVVTYSNSSKVDVLGVPEHLIKSLGAVSGPVATSMAKNAQEKFKSTWSVAVTGIAGPGGGSPDKPVGTVWIAVCGPSFEYVERQVFEGSREQVQQRAVEHAFGLLLEKSL